MSQVYAENKGDFIWWDVQGRYHGFKTQYFNCEYIFLINQLVFWVLRCTVTFSASGLITLHSSQTFNSNQLLAFTLSWDFLLFCFVIRYTLCMKLLELLHREVKCGDLICSRFQWEGLPWLCLLVISYSHAVVNGKQVRLDIHDSKNRCFVVTYRNFYLKH